MENIPEAPGAELRMAAAGPAVSLQGLENGAGPADTDTAGPPPATS